MIFIKFVKKILKKKTTIRINNRKENGKTVNSQIIFYKMK